MVQKKRKNSPTPRVDDSELIPIEDLLREAQEAAKRATPENTLRAYRADWNDFRNWCKRRKLSALPAAPLSVCAYLAARAKTHKTASLRRRLTVIAKLHKI